ncbi:hypothetical protein SCLCIDRAFT_838963 [Scleroderma citrinum Foug A]|uniref:Uncharacterized protein n=1 Tax=Scleroderma citrinum Foug A TaxID=1036808 RepID=A0A0C3DNI7_9AGAM|nr:hypothetical protein SCLCIDRAFT_838963 [Scleroderma citrinum Foug A]
MNKPSGRQQLVCCITASDSCKHQHIYLSFRGVPVSTHHCLTTISTRVRLPQSSFQSSARSLLSQHISQPSLNNRLEYRAGGGISSCQDSLTL